MWKIGGREILNTVLLLLK